MRRAKCGVAPCGVALATRYDPRQQAAFFFATHVTTPVTVFVTILVTTLVTQTAFDRRPPLS